MDLISVADAAERLGVSERHVRRLAEAGELSARRVGGRWLIDAEAVRDRSRSEPRSGRPLSLSTACAVLAATNSVLEAGEDSPSPFVARIEDRRLRYRLRALLADAPPPHQWNHWLRHRAAAERVWVHPGVLDRFADDDRLHPAGGSVVASAGLGIAPGDRWTFYVGENVLEEVLVDYRAQHSDDGQVVMMVVPAEVSATVLGGPGEPVMSAMVLVDLLASRDARERHVAAEALNAARQKIISSSTDDGVSP
jgi:excisionase family DNA binding protein